MHDAMVLSPTEASSATTEAQLTIKQYFFVIATVLDEAAAEIILLSRLAVREPSIEQLNTLILVEKDTAKRAVHQAQDLRCMKDACSLA